MKKGDIVLIRASQGAPGVRRVWNPAPDRPFVCLEEYWARWERNQVDPVCWQVQRGDIFLHDSGLAAALQDAYADLRDGDPAAAQRLEALWNQAKPAA